MGVRRPEWVVAGAVLVCSPMLPGVLDGAVGTATALERFLGALLVCWVAGALITSVLDRYADSVDRRQLERELARRAAGPPGGQAGTAAAPGAVLAGPGTVPTPVAGGEQAGTAGAADGAHGAAGQSSA